MAAEDGREEEVVMAAVGLEVVEREAVSLGKAVAVKAGGVKEAVAVTARAMDWRQWWWRRRGWWRYARREARAWRKGGG